MRLSLVFRLAVCIAMLVAVGGAKAQIKSSQAKKLISTVAGIELPSNSVRVNKVSAVDPSTTHVVAEVETGIRLERDEEGQWSVQEIRIGPDRWNNVAAVASSFGFSQSDSCLPETQGGLEATSLTPRRARCLLAELLGVPPSSDAVRVRSVSPLDLPFVSRPSAVVDARLRVNFALVRADKGAWRISAIQSGHRAWLSIENLERAIEAQKLAGARSDLQTVAAALEKFRTARGFYVKTDDEAVLINHLSPYYLAKVIRVDPWHQPYRYEGTNTSFTLRSDGPDRKPNTPDDVVLSHP